MDFKETYKKYLDGTATDEEKSFVEAEIERARLVNNEVISATAEKKSAENIKKSKKKYQLTIAVILCMIIAFFSLLVVLEPGIVGYDDSIGFLFLFIGAFIPLLAIPLLTIFIIKNKLSKKYIVIFSCLLFFQLYRNSSWSV